MKTLYAHCSRITELRRCKNHKLTSRINITTYRYDYSATTGPEALGRLYKDNAFSKNSEMFCKRTN